MAMSPTKTTVNVEVTPKLKQGSETYCEIDAASGSGQFVKGGIIKLRKSGAGYEVKFKLMSPATLGGDDHCWKPDDDRLRAEDGCAATVSSAFWSHRGACPTSAMQDSQVKNVTISGDVLTVEIVPDGSPNAIHYSLNFADGTSFDPIIIHT
jgi:hypothetical protein